MRWVLAFALAMPVSAFAQDGGAEREMSTDRPDKTESPYTVPDGRVQIEMDAATYTRDRIGDVVGESVGVAPVNFKLGIGRDTDVQLIVEPYLRQTMRDLNSGARAANAGFGDVTLRLKHNLWGNDDGTTAFGLMPFVKLPTNSGGVGNGRVEAGLIAPLAIELSDSVALGLMSELDLVENGAADGYRVNVIHSATAGFSLTEKLGLYTELYTERGDDWIVTGDAGVTYRLIDTLQIDTGVNLGISDAADDVAVFAGVSRRF